MCLIDHTGENESCEAIMAERTDALLVEVLYAHST